MVTLVWLYIMKCAAIPTTKFALLVNKSLSDCKNGCFPIKTLSTQSLIVAFCYYFPSDYGTIPRQANGHGINSDTATSEIGEDAPVINVNVKNKSHYRRT